MTGKFLQANRCLNLRACKIYNFTTKCVNGHKGFLCACCVKGCHKTGEVCAVCPTEKETVKNISITVVLSVLLVLIVVLVVLMKWKKDELNIFLSHTKICINYFYFSLKIYDIMT